jgi:ElaB/YqjD/DUF883 family membrane-anchored ribosome-binding protein
VAAKGNGREIYKQAEVARKDVVKRLFDTAESIRNRTKGVEGDARDNADRIARNLEQTANYFNGRAIDQMEETTEVMREHVWETTMVAFLIGLIIGFLIGYGSKE